MDSSIMTCYVSIPFGKKSDIQGNIIDFDNIYNIIIKPAVEGAGLLCIRGDDVAAGGLIQKNIISAVISSDVFIADITTGNPNVFYELGIRHTARRSITILLSQANYPIPSNISYVKILFYQLQPGGIIDTKEASLTKQNISAAIRMGLEYKTDDSPIYEFFPGLNVMLPDENVLSQKIVKSFSRYKKSRTYENTSSSESPRDKVKSAEKEILQNQDADPVSLVNVLKAYRDVSAWGDLIELASATSTPPIIRNSPEVKQLLALALNRRGEKGDQEQAIDVIQSLIKDTGGDPESYGILGRIYKDRFAATTENSDLEAAMHSYKQGFNLDSTNFYTGINIITLLLQRNNPQDKAELQAILPIVRNAVNGKIENDRVGYWEFATALHLACIAKDWGDAHNCAEKAIDKNPSAWMLETTIQDLKKLEKIMEKTEVENLNNLINFLIKEGYQEEVSNA
jgi:tetratricopeptide (TPR) repeat protein